MLDRKAIEKGVAAHIDTAQAIARRLLTPKERQAIRAEHERVANKVDRRARGKK